jgi:putative phosphoribosyl transferase
MFESLLSRFQLKFKDRTCAANVLAESLKDIIKKETRNKNKLVVLGIPRGGLIIASVIATKLDASLDIIIPRKLRAPHNEEVAIGSIMEEGMAYLSTDLVKTLDISSEYIEKEKAEQIEEIRRRAALYRQQQQQQRQQANLQSKSSSQSTVIIADDGAATGATIIIAARWIRKTHNPKKLIIAVPVVPKQVVKLLKNEADHVETITTPSTSGFKSVSQYYQDFTEITDQQVIDILSRNKE